MDTTPATAPSPAKRDRASSSIHIKINRMLLNIGGALVRSLLAFPTVWSDGSTLFGALLEDLPLLFHQEGY